MFYRSKFYLLDCGRKFVFCPLKITAPPAMIPTNLMDLLEPANLGYCPFEVRPRKAILKMTDGEIFTIEYPFSPATPEWFALWQELQQNSSIVSLGNTGEFVPDSILRSWLL